MCGSLDSVGIIVGAAVGAAGAAGAVGAAGDEGDEGDEGGCSMSEFLFLGDVGCICWV